MLLQKKILCVKAYIKVLYRSIKVNIKVAISTFKNIIFFDAKENLHYFSNTFEILDTFDCCDG